MKVADLFGAGVPVCALDYGACLAERVRHGDNGLLFSTARQLADVLFDLFETFPADQTLLDRLRTARANRRGRRGKKDGRERKRGPKLLPWIAIKPVADSPIYLQSAVCNLQFQPS